MNDLWTDNWVYNVLIIIVILTAAGLAMAYH